MRLAASRNRLFEFGRWRKVACFRCLAVCVLIRLACLIAGLLCPRLRGGGRIKPGLQLGDSCLPFVQFRVERADLPEVATLERGELAPKIDKLQFALRERRANGRKLLAFAEDFLLFWFQPPGEMA